MSWNIAFLLLAVVPADDKGKPKHFENYTRAYFAAEQAKRPMLVILNPGREAGEKPISLDAIRRDEQRRKLLEKYVVAVIDTGTSHGKTIRELFGSEKLPRVVVIERPATVGVDLAHGEGLSIAVKILRPVLVGGAVVVIVPGTEGGVGGALGGGHVQLR